jgi:hypothetical protein
MIDAEKLREILRWLLGEVTNGKPEIDKAEFCANLAYVVECVLVLAENTEIDPGMVDQHREEETDEWGEI